MGSDCLEMRQTLSVETELGTMGVLRCAADAGRVMLKANPGF